MSSTTEPTILKREEEAEEESKPSAEDEDTGAQVAPIVQLQEVAVTTGEENEEVLIDLKSKLYRFDKEGNQWKERGVGMVKLLKHKESSKVRLVMRQNKTLKICANHLVLPTLVVQEHQGNEKSCVWHAADFADGELKEETFCIRFASVENCKSFKDKIEEITESMSQNNGESEEGNTAANLIESESPNLCHRTITESLSQNNGESEEGNTAANLIEQLSFEGKEEKKTEAKEAPASSSEEKK